MIYNHKLSNQLVTLRNIKTSDELVSYLCWLSDHAVNQFLEIRFNLPGSITDLRKYVKMINQSSDSILFGIFDTETNTHVGNIKLGPVNSYHRVAEIGLLIGNKSFWGQGYGGEATMHFKS